MAVLTELFYNWGKVLRAICVFRTFFVFWKEEYSAKKVENWI